MNPGREPVKPAGDRTPATGPCRLCKDHAAVKPPGGDGICDPCSHRMEVLELEQMKRETG